MEWIQEIGLIALCAHSIGILTAINAIMKTRTSQGAIAWALTLFMFPYIAVPAYWIFGRNRFHGYVEARRSENRGVEHMTQTIRGVASEYLVDGKLPYQLRTFENLADFPFSRRNSIQLLIDGQATFDAIFAAIEKAEKYVLVQFYIIHDDELGRALQTRLIERAKAGVRVYVLYDEIGSYGLSRKYVHELREAGIEIVPFHTTKGRGNRFQLNFRNHRKIVIVDGQTAFVGGHNVGDEYMGRSKTFGPWRDTHVVLRGPAVQAVQRSFLEDWNWATHELPQVDWAPRPTDEDQQVLVLPTGPADDFERCTLFFVQAINMAEKRVWIATPYFVPDPPVIAALQLAAIRGCDVRIMLPERPDHILVYLSAFSFIAEAAPHGVRFFRYEPGFLHQKVVLIDDDFAAVGTANLDNRSFHLNFEIMIAAADTKFAADVAAMLEADFTHCREAHAEELEKQSYLFRLTVALSRLMAPIQ
ncbi:cardiolipin synthase [Blastopirellula sp. JC732]|uniref:Cardiolipin synthase n=1 Tax=Blastopirellula sediminis TaxID=2894196 RepID=A0A9X1SIB4_9BACT|nr:cardiolipin synthase [Blastopirellula sediminis]MCC9604576.1 cardiolipin synthase [Blastopirellula sediminis]MCC9632125.1 cardiolipin synthase [Blastopirellula sediminis]